MNVLKYLSRSKDESGGEKLDRWRQQLWEAVPGMCCDEEDRYGMDDDGDIAIKKGCATLFVNFGLDEHGAGWVHAYSPLVFMPNHQLLPFYRKLLDINDDASVVGRLSTREDVVHLARSFRTDIDGVNGVVFAVGALAREADAIAEYLMEEFEARSTEIDVFAA